MFGEMLKGLTGVFGRRATKATKEEKLAAATSAMVAGEARDAIELYRDYLKIDPFNVQALNDLGVCLADIGNAGEAAKNFELAYSLDDTYIAAVVNHAKLLLDRRCAQEAISHLRIARLNDPGFSHVDSIYAGVCLRLGRVADARHFQLKAWMANFDNLRLANGYLFDTTYADVAETTLAAEHKFWGGTLRPLAESKEVQSLQSPSQEERQKIRIGYWSPDFRSHSVRYFFRPLIENHDKEKFEIFLYYDFYHIDEQTEAIKSTGDHFFQVFEDSDEKLEKLIKSHHLDLLVELAGHSSENRLPLMRRRLAKIQLSGLGYPPTTGLETIDAKLMDRHIHSSEAARFYTERPLVLPSSFWCFDPMETVVQPGPVPSKSNGYITFGCAGNIAKINNRILQCWRAILRRVPRSRLLLRSISFEDPAAEQAFRSMLADENLPMDRVDLKLPAGGAAYFDSYNEIDIVLDTYPFNGGTTSCFAIYMGVPMVSWAGEALASRMGLSILQNIGAAELAVRDSASYVSCAVRLSQDIKYLENFRLEARKRMGASALGNGKMFAQEFEIAVQELLESKSNDGGLPYSDEVVPLASNEMVKRAYAVLRRGQPEAALRIASYCLKIYPDCGTAHILYTNHFTDRGEYREAAEYLSDRLEAFTAEEQSSTLINIVRFLILADRHDDARSASARLAALNPADPLDRQQLAMYEAHFSTHSPAKHDQVEGAARTAEPFAKRMVCVVPSDDVQLFESIRRHISTVCSQPSGWHIDFIRCNESDKISSYEKLLADDSVDILVLIQKNIEIHEIEFFSRLIDALETADVIGFAGATRWSRLHWIGQDVATKAGCFILDAGERTGFLEIQWLGLDQNPVAPDMRVLEGALLAAKHTAATAATLFNPQLVGSENLLEQEWSHRVALAGGRLSVHRGLGVKIKGNEAADASNRIEARDIVSTEYGFDVLAVEVEDHSLISVPVATVSDALRTIDNYLKHQ